MFELARSLSPAARTLALGTLVLCGLLVVIGTVPAFGSGTTAAAGGQANVTVSHDTTDGVASVDVRISNDGAETGRYTVELVAENTGAVAERDLRVPPNGTRLASFDVEVSETTAYAVYVNGIEIERFTVTAPEQSNPTDDRHTPGPIVVSLLGGAAVLGAGAVLFRLT